MSFLDLLALQFEQELKKYFQSCGVNFDITQIIKKLKDPHIDISVMITEQKKRLPRPKLLKLTQTLNSKQFIKIFQNQKEKHQLVSSDKFHQIQRIFEMMDKDRYLLNFLIKVAKGNAESNDVKQFESRLKQVQIEMFHEIIQNNQLIKKTNQGEKLANFDDLYKQLKQFFNFINGNTQNLIQSILNQRFDSKMISKLQKEMKLQEFQMLKKMINSENFKKITDKIHYMKSSIQLKNHHELKEFFKAIDFDMTNFIQRILNGQSQSQVLKLFQDEIPFNDYEDIQRLIQSKAYIQLKQRILKSNKFDEKRNQLLQIMKGIDGVPQSLIDNILSCQSTQKIMSQLQENMVYQQFEKLDSLMKDEKMVIFRSTLFQEKQRNQLINLFKPLKIDTTELIHTILKNQSIKRCLKIFKQKNSKKQFEQLSKILKNPQFQQSKNRIKHYFLSKIREELFNIFKQAPIDVSYLINWVIQNKSYQDILNQLKKKKIAKKDVENLHLVLNSQEIKIVRQKLSKLSQQQDQQYEPQKESYLQKKIQRLNQIFATFKDKDIIVQKIILLQEKSQRLQVLKKLKMTKKQYQQCQRLLNQKQIVIILKEIKIYNKIKNFNIAKDRIIKAIINGQNSQQSQILVDLSDSMPMEQYQQLQQLLNSEDMDLLRESLQFQIEQEYQLYLKRKKQLQHIFKPTKLIPVKKIIKAILKGQEYQKYILILKNTMKSKYTQIKQLLCSKQVIQLKEKSLKYSRLMSFFKQFSEKKINIVQAILNGVLQIDILRQLQDQLSKQNYQKLKIIFKSKEFNQLAQTLNIVLMGNVLKQQLAIYFKDIAIDLSNLQQSILANDISRQKQQIIQLSKKVTQDLFKNIEVALYSSQLIKFRLTKLFLLNTIIQELDYCLFSQIIKEISKTLKHQTFPGLNIYQIVSKFIRKQDISDLLKYPSLEQILDSKKIFMIMRKDQKNQDKLDLSYLLRSVKYNQYLVESILHGKNDNQIQKILQQTKRQNQDEFIKLKSALENTQLKGLRERLILRKNLGQIIGNGQFQRKIIDILLEGQIQSLDAQLKEAKAKMNINEFQNLKFNIYSAKVQAILQRSIIKNVSIRNIMNYFQNQQIFCSCIQFLEGLLSQNSIKQILQKYQSDFSRQTYQKIKNQLKQKAFLSLITQNKFQDRLKPILKQIMSLMDKCKYKQQFAQQILYGYRINEYLNERLNLEPIQQLQTIYQIFKNLQLQKILQKNGLKIPEFSENYIVFKNKQRLFFRKQTKLSKIQTDKRINCSQDKRYIFINKDHCILDENYCIAENIQCLQSDQYEIILQNDNEISIFLPHKQSVLKNKKIIQNYLQIQNQLSLKIKKIQQFKELQDQTQLRKCRSKELYLNYYINLIIKLQYKQEELNFKILNNQTIAKAQIRIEKIIDMKRQSQRWFLDCDEIIDTQNITFEKLKIKNKNVRIKILQDRCLEYYGFDQVIPIERSSFKSFYIQDDEQTKNILKSQDFPKYSWREAFRNICLGYIFSAIKKHSRIQSALKHIKDLVEQSGLYCKLWRPKTSQQKQLFNETYIIYNIIKSSKTQLRIDIFKCLMGFYPIPLIIVQQDQKFQKLYEENYWIMNKAFNIISFGLSKDIKNQTEGKSTLLNIFFDTNFQDKSNCHRQCQSGVSIHYNIYQNDEYYVNLIDVSNKIKQNVLLQLIQNSNLIIIHTKQKEQFVQSWMKQNKISLPVIIFKRDVKNIFQDAMKQQRQKEKNNNNKTLNLKKYSLIQIKQKSLNFYSQYFNQIAVYVQNFVRQVYMRQDHDSFWKFTNYLAQNCPQNYLSFNKILQQLHKTEQNLSRITNYFYQSRIINYQNNLSKEAQNQKKLKEIDKKVAKEGISEVFKKILYFYQDYPQKSVYIISKLRLFLTLIRNQLFSDFYKLYKLLHCLADSKTEQFLQRKKNLIQLLENISKLKSSFITQKLKQCISQFKIIESKYKQPYHIDDDFKRIFKIINNQFQNEIQPKTCSIENFWREVIYMCKFDPNYTFSRNNQTTLLHQTIINLSKKQINDSQNFEIINGDLLEMPTDFLRKVFENNQGKKIMIIAIFGPQSSGKSTLLNFVLGCDFMSSVGRCTKGIYGTYFQISNKQIRNCQAILVLDTQGLFSNYKNEKFKNRNGFDNKLVLFCLQVCDLIIMNVKGDITNQCQEILADAFDSSIVDAKNLPIIYFVLNLNGGPINPTQSNEIQRVCDLIIKLNPSADRFVSVNYSKGMPMAFKEIQRKSYLKKLSQDNNISKKMPTDVFYKQTKKFSHQIFKILSNRAQSRNGRSLSQAIDDMALTWATINRHTIMTVNGSRKIKILQMKIQQWMKFKLQQVKLTSSKLKQQLSNVPYRQIQKWEKNNIAIFQKIKIQIKGDFEAEFPTKQGQNLKAYNSCISNFYNEIDSIIIPIIEDLKRSITEHRYRMQMKQSQQNGLDDIFCLVKEIKNKQLDQKKQMDKNLKIQSFNHLWQKRINQMNEKLNRKMMAQQNFKNIEQLYASALKAENKNYYKFMDDKYTIDLNNLPLQDFNSKLVKRIKQKYKNETIFKNSGEQPIMNIQKNTGDLSYKYLDMSQYFNKSQQTIFASIQSKYIKTLLNKEFIQAHIKSQVQKCQDYLKIGVIDQIYDDFKHLMGISLKKKRLQQFVNHQFNDSYFKNMPFSSSKPKKIDIQDDVSEALYYQTIRHGIGQVFKLFTFLIIKNKIHFYPSYQNTQKSSIFHTKFKVINKIPDYIEKIYTIICQEPCQQSLSGNNVIINKILKIILQFLEQQHRQQKSTNNLKKEVQLEIFNQINQDLQKINVKIQQTDDFLDNLYKNQLKFVKTCKKQRRFESEDSIKLMFQSFKYYFKKQMLIKNYNLSKNAISSESSVVFGSFPQSFIAVKKQYQSYQILQNYIGKKYQEFLEQMSKSNFKQFIQNQLKYDKCFEEIYNFILQKIESYDLNLKVVLLKNKVNQILQQINKDLKQVSQTIRVDFIVDIHTYAFHLLWITTLNSEWSKKQNLIKQFNVKKEKQMQRFLDLTSGEVEKENKAASDSFIAKYITFLNNKIALKKRQYAKIISQRYHSTYTRQQIQDQIQAELHCEQNPNVLASYLLKPQQYMQKYFVDSIQKSYLVKLQKYSDVNYQTVILQLKKIIQEISLSFTSEVKENSIQDIFQINQLKQSKNKAFCLLFYELLSNKKKYVSHQEKIGQFRLKNGQRFKRISDFQFKQNIQFITSIKTGNQQLLITNIKFFLQFLQKNLLNIISSGQLKLQLNLKDKQEALKELKVQICKKVCPLCKKACDIDMIVYPNHSIHKCTYGHQIRAIGGMIIQQCKNNKIVYKASILRCSDLTPDSKFQWNGKPYKWSQFKLQYNDSWDFQTSQSSNSKKQFYQNLWKRAGQIICQHYSQNAKIIQFVDYTQQQIQSQNIKAPHTHFIFGIDESGSMRGQRWDKAVSQLQKFIQIISNNNLEKNQQISLFKFNLTSTIIYSSIPPEDFNKNILTMSGGGTKFSSAFKSSIELIQKNLHKDNIFIIITDGEAQYPKDEIEKLKELKKNQQIKTLAVRYTSIFIDESETKKSPILEKIRLQLDGEHRFTDNRIQISSMLKEIHYNK